MQAAAIMHDIRRSDELITEDDRGKLVELAWAIGLPAQYPPDSESVESTIEPTESWLCVIMTLMRRSWFCRFLSAALSPSDLLICRRSARFSANRWLWPISRGYIFCNLQHRAIGVKTQPSEKRRLQAAVRTMACSDSRDLLEPSRRAPQAVPPPEHLRFRGDRGVSQNFELLLRGVR